ncbi:MAG: hypothetical protein ACRC57_10150 [Sarcina sp.]
MKIFTLKKYDNFILSKFESPQKRYFFMSLPHKLIIIAFLLFFLRGNLLSFIMIGFFLTLDFIFSATKKKN